MDNDTLNFYLEVVHDLIARDVPATVENISKHLAPANREDEIVAALAALVTEGRLVKSAKSQRVERYQLA